MLTECAICDKPFEAKVHNQTMCSKSCVRKYRAAKQREYVAKNKVVVKRYSDCAICGTNFELAPKSSAKTCSKACSKEQTRLRHKSYIGGDGFKERAKKSNIKHNASGKRAEWVDANRKKLTANNVAYVKQRKQKDKGFHMMITLRAAVGRMYKQQRHTKTLKDIVNYTPEELKQHLESQFRDGMTWENYGRLGWHIDYIKPLTAFAFFDEKGNMNYDAFVECMSLENLQPLWYDENIRKGGLRNMRTN